MKTKKTEKHNYTGQTYNLLTVKENCKTATDPLTYDMAATVFVYVQKHQCSKTKQNPFLMLLDDKCN